MNATTLGIMKYICFWFGLSRTWRDQIKNNRWGAVRYYCKFWACTVAAGQGLKKALVLS